VSAKHTFCQWHKSVGAKPEIGKPIKLHFQLYVNDMFVSHKIIPYRGPSSAPDNTTTEYGLKNFTSIFTKNLH
jgi:hypothetical protein